jgi:hypothetical protein
MIKNSEATSLLEKRPILPPASKGHVEPWDIASGSSCESTLHETPAKCNEQSNILFPIQASYAANAM